MNFVNDTLPPECRKWWSMVKDGSAPYNISKRQRSILLALIDGEEPKSRPYAVRALILRGYVSLTQRDGVDRYAITEQGYNIVHPPIPTLEEIGDLVVPEGGVPMRLNKGFTIVDPEDYPALSRYRWRLDPSGYAYREAMQAERGPGVDRKKIALARVLLPAPLGMTVDHINRNRLDNRRRNLRLATRLQQQWNKMPTTQGYIGVVIGPDGFHMRYKHNGHHVTKGPFMTPEAAARAYDASILEHRGEFAVLNFSFSTPPGTDGREG